MAVPAIVPAPAVLLIHGGSGLTDLFKSYASDFARDGFLALALDLYDGRVAADDPTRDLSMEVYAHSDQATETINTWIAWLRADKRTNGKVGVVGWSFGANWAMRASYAVPVDATVIYVALYFPLTENFALLKGPVLGHFGERDASVRQSNAERFERKIKEAGKSATIYWYPGDHYFPFSNRPSYDKELADTAWARTLQFLRANLQ
jgi:carboxymethylenebutenolidase